MSLSAPQSATVFRACVVNAVKESEALMAQLVRGTRSSLSEAEQRATGVQERMHLGDALRALDQQEAALLKRYPMALLETFVGDDEQASPQARPVLDVGIDFGELALVDDTEVMAQVELARAQQIASHATDAALAELNTYVSSVQGLSNVQPERNPFRPENYIRALQRSLDESQVSSDIRQLWMERMREILGAELTGTYQRVTQSLREHGVMPVGYTVAVPVGAQRSGGQGGGGRHGSPVVQGLHGASGAPHTGFVSSGFGAVSHRGYPGWHAQGAGGGMRATHGGLPQQVVGGADAEEAMLTMGILRQMLAAGGDPFAHELPPQIQRGAVSAPNASVPAVLTAQGAASQASAVHSHPGATVVQAAEAMEDIAQLERLVGRLSGHLGGAPGQMGTAVPIAVGGVAGVTVPGAPSNWQDLSIPANLSAYDSLSSRSASEVLSRMMDHISQDSRLLAPVQRAVQNLEPSLKQLVRQDPSFFSNEQHPARRLLDELTQRSLTFKNEDAAGFRKYIQLVNAAVQHLSTVPVHDAKAFEHVSGALESAWNTQVQQLRKQQAAEQQALLAQEQREMLAARLARDFQKLPEAQNVPVDILEFVTGVWADVAADAQVDALQQGRDHADSDPHGYLALVPQLLSCAQPGHSPEDAKYLSPLLDGMASTVRRGMRSVGQSEENIALIMRRMAALQREIALQAKAPPEAPQMLATPPLSQTTAQPVDLPLEPVADQKAVQQPSAPQGTEPAPEQQDEISANVEALATDTQAPATENRDAEECAAVDVGQELQLGEWVELTTNQRTVRTQLTWVSPHNTLFLFTGLDASTQSMTRRMLDKLTAEGMLRKIGDQRVVSRALGAVVADANARGKGKAG